MKNLLFDLKAAFFRRRLVLFFMIFFLGCSKLGSNAIPMDRNNYNAAIQRSSDEQLLLNLVRLKYRDNPSFLEVSSVATQFTLSADAKASAGLPAETSVNIFGLGAGAAYTERPTITYTPLQGDKFIQRVLSPISLENISLLYHSGWSAERLFRLCLQRLGHLKNAPGASGPTPKHVPDYKEFWHAAQLLRFLQIRDALEIYYEAEIEALVIQIKTISLNWPETLEFFALLKLNPGKTRYTLSAKRVTDDSSHILVEPRSLLGIMFYLSQSVEVPKRHREEGKVTVTTQSSGEPFDWGRVIGDIFHIQSQLEKPLSASTTINYRGSWFYIDDSDLASKSTFSLLSQIFSLQAGKIKSTEPLLTLPLGQ